MIIGIGHDIVDVRRIECVLSKHESRFLKRVFTPGEQSYAIAYSAHRQRYVGILAKRFAAKEAASKALGTGFRNGISFQDIEVISRENGQPCLHLMGAAWQHAVSLAPDEASPRLFVTLSDEFPYASAVVVIEG